MNNAHNLVNHLVQIGDLEKAGKVAEEGIRETGEDRLSRAFWIFRFARAEVLRMHGQHGAALEYLDSLGEPPESDIVSRSELFMHRGYNAAILGQYSVAHRLLDTAERMADLPERLEFWAEVKLRQAMVAYLEGKFGAAEQMYRAISAAVEGKCGWFVCMLAVGGIGTCLMAQREWEAALPWLDKGLKAADSAGATYRAALTSGEIALCYLGLGQRSRALEILIGNERLLGAMGAEHAYQVCIADIGSVYFQEGQYLTAVSYYERALEIARRINAPASVEKWTYNIGVARAKLRDSFSAASR